MLPVKNYNIDYDLFKEQVDIDFNLYSKITPLMINKKLVHFIVLEMRDKRSFRKLLKKFGLRLASCYAIERSNTYTSWRNYHCERADNHECSLRGLN